MKKNILLWLTVLMSISAFAQKHYEKGHIVTVGNKNFKGYLLHEDLFHTPTEFYFKQQLTDKRKTISAEEVKTVVINPNLKYERHTVKIDLNNTRTSNNTRISNFLPHSLLLKVILEGDITLLSYETSKIKRFFVKKGNNIIPLEYKKYKIDDKINYNRNYLKQLRDSFACNLQFRLAPSYTAEALMNYFETYAECKQLKIKNLTKIKVIKNRKGIFKLRAKLGVANTTFLRDIPHRFKFQTNAIGLQYGLEAEYIFPFNNHRLSVFIEPTFISRRTATYTLPTKLLEAGHYSAIDFEDFRLTEYSHHGFEIPIGLKNYWFISDKNAITLHGGILFSMPDNSYLRYTNMPEVVFTPSNTTSVFMGIGYDYNKKMSIELRYNAHREFTSETLTISDVSLKIGYSIF